MADERDPKVSRRYGELGAEEPARALDQAILAAARRAVDQPHAPLVTPAGRHRWYFSLAAAAILVLAVAVTVQIERQQPDLETMQSPPAAPPVVLAERQAALEEAPKPPPKPAPKASARFKAEAPGKVEEAPVFVPAPATVPEPARREAAGAAADVAASRARESVRGIQEPAPQPALVPQAARPAPGPAAKQAPLMRSDAAARLATTPDQDLERIAELRRQERHGEADKALAEFRKRYPDYKIPGAMLERVERR